MRSSNRTPLPRYFLAMEITSLRFDSMSRARASLSPSRARLLSSRSSRASSNRPPRIFPRYCVRVSCSIPSPFSADVLRRRVRPAPHARPTVHYEPFRNPLVQAARYTPVSPTLAPELREPPFVSPDDRLFERAEAARRQPPHIHLGLGLAHRGERRVRSQALLARHYAAPFRSPSLARSVKAHSSGSTGRGACQVAPHSGHSKEASKLLEERRQHPGRSTS